MRVTVTVLAPGSRGSGGSAADVSVETAAHAPLADLLPDLAACLGLAPADATMASIDGHAIDTSLDVETVLRDGCLLTLSATGSQERPALLVRAGRHELRVIGGPSAGAALPLVKGRFVIGRSPAGEICLDDPGASRTHAAVTASTDGVTVVDMHSTNGTTIDGSPIDTAVLSAGAVLGIGSSTLTIATPTHVPMTLHRGPGGQRSFNRPPRVSPHRAPVSVEFPAPPAPRGPSQLPVIAVMAPLLLGVVLAVVIRRPEFLLFALLSPTVMAAQWLSDRLGLRRSGRAATREFSAAYATAEAALARALRQEEAHRRALAPDAATLADIASGPSSRLWERRAADDDFATLRLGLADLPARLEARGRSGEQVLARRVPLVVQLGHSRAADVPSTGVLGIAGGPGDRVLGLARFVVTQAAVLHSPRELGIVLLTTPDRAGRWAWCRWIPHLRPADGQDCQLLVGTDTATVTARVAELTALAHARRAVRTTHTGPSPERAILLVIDTAQDLRDVPGLADLLRQGPQVGIVVLCLDSDPAQLPETCTAVAVVSGYGGTRVTLQTDDGKLLEGLIDAVSGPWAERVARAVAALRDDTPGIAATDLPREVRWLSLSGLPADDLAAAIGERWQQGTSTSTILGAGPTGPFHVDLVRDGPHALVAGTTGSGKSELLQTLVGSLAASSSPEDLTFLLVDYKGGAAFGACAALPHTVGLVTDLDGPLTQRALTCLDAELRRRERLLAEAGAVDLIAYRRAGCRLARLVLVVDEFATLAEELPDFVRGLVSIAQRGRSLGLHLVLATQRPEGVVSADIRANTQLRICMAVPREAESRDVIDSPVAAHLDRRTPGRAFARTGHAELHAFQTARVGGGPVDGSALRPRVQVAPFGSLGDPTGARGGACDQPAPGQTPSDLDLIVDACRSAAIALDLELPTAPWPPPLPPALVIPEHPGGLRLPLARQDRPDLQSQPDLTFDLDTAGHLLVVGTSRSGRTTVLRTLAGAVGRGTSAADVHLYGIDGGNGALSSVVALPHCGAVVEISAQDRLHGLLGFLLAEVDRRTRLLSAQSCGSLADQRARASVDERIPHLLVLVDGWESLAAHGDSAVSETVIDTMWTLLRDGGSVGIHLAITADRAGLVGRLASTIDQRLVLRLADKGDYTGIGMPPRAVPTDMPPGRGTWVDGLVTAQTFLLDDDPSALAQVSALAAIARSAHARDAHLPSACLPRRFDALPLQVRLSQLDRADLEAPAARQVLLGLSADHEPVAVDLDDAGPGFAIAGPARSGRSTALVTLAVGLHAAGRTALVVAVRASPLRAAAAELGFAVFTDWGDATALREYLAKTAAAGNSAGAADRANGIELPALIVDDAELLTASPVGDLLDQLAQSARQTGQLLILAGTTEDLAVGFRGFVAEARRSRSGVLLCPRSPLDGEVLAVRLPRGAPWYSAPVASDGPAGRGLLVVRGAVEQIQVALP